MSATINERRRMTMSSGEVRFRQTFTGAATCLSDADVVVTANVSRMVDQHPSALRPEFVEAMTRLVDLAPNWDGCHAKVPSPAVLERVASLLSDLPDDMPAPEVLASVDGGVMLEWESDSAELLLHLKADELTAVVSLDGHEVEGPYGLVREEVTDALVRLTGLS